MMKAKQLKLHVTKVAASLAKEYVDSNSCLACQAAKRQFKTPNVSAGPYTIHIDGQNYLLARKGQQIQAAYVGRDNRQKIRQPFKPFTVTLTPC